MAKPKQQKTNLVAVPVERAGAPYWKTFFRDQRSPVLRSQIITALMSGHLLEVERLPTPALLDVAILASTTRNYFNAEIVDDFDALLQRVRKAWDAPDWTRKTFDQYHNNAASFIVYNGTTEFTCYEDLYIPEFVGGLLLAEPPSYFQELQAPKAKAA